MNAEKNLPIENLEKSNFSKADKTKYIIFSGQLPTIFTKDYLEKLVEKKNKKITLSEGSNNEVQSLQPVMVSTVIYKTEKNFPINLLNLLGIKVDLKSKIEKFKEEYMKNYAMSKSHNLLVGRFAALKYAFYGALLSLLGVSVEEITFLQTTAKNNLIAQSLTLLEENEYAGEMLEIMGGPKKRIKAERTLIDEVRKQLILQISNCGRKDLCTDDKILLMKRNQCQKIIEKITEEKMSLEYELLMINSGIYPGNPDETKLKIEKINKYLLKAQRRLEGHDNQLQKKFKTQLDFNIDDKVKIIKRSIKNAN